MLHEKKRKISFFTVIIFIVTMFSNIVVNVADASDDEAPFKIDSTAVLVGDLMQENNLGDNWQPSNYKGQLKEYKNGIFEGGFNLKKGDYQYKIAMNGTWDESYAGTNIKDGNTILSLSEDSNVYFRLDLKNKKVYDSINNPDQFKSKAIITGNIDNIFDGGQAWVPSDDKFKLDYIGGGMYIKTFDIKEAAQNNDYDLSFKVAFNGDWNNGEIPSQNYNLKIPKGNKNITILANYLTGEVYESINTPNINNEVSLIGTIRCDENNNWNENNKDFDMYKIDSSRYIYSIRLSAGSYEYKSCLNHSWNESYPSNNKKLDIKSDTNVVFITDLNEKNVYDSINDLDKVNNILGATKIPEVLSGPVINDDGKVTFKYKNEASKEVYLVGNMTNWDSGKILMTKNNEGVWSTSLRVGDNAQALEYKFIVDGKYITDPLNEKIKDGNSFVDFPEYKGRPVTLPGSIQSAIGQGSWDPTKTEFTYIGNGNYKLELKNVKPGTYEYKIAINHSWDPENYGLKGVEHGSNISIIVPKETDITFLYNDDSHMVVNSLTYKVLDITLKNGDDNIGKLEDKKLSGIYSFTANLNAGEYKNLSLKIVDEDKSEKNIKVQSINLSVNKSVTFSFDPITEICFNDSSDMKINTNMMKYDSRKEEYKKPYGSTSVGEDINFNFSTDKDMAKEVKMVIGTPNGTIVKDMTKNGSFNDNTDKWTYVYKPESIGTYSYYFVASNGSDVKAYGDDDGFFGAGVGGNIGEVKNYEFNIHVKDFKTPDWLKNGVIYQIFPDRFFNGDSRNDYLQTYARGNAPYEYISDWYSLPKDPDLMNKEGFDYPKNANKGDINEWSNDVYGGDLKGIEKKINYLKSLGVTILYLNPIGQSISSHRYDTTDYKNVDPLLGTMDDFVNLSKVAKENGMHIILDGVYNHVADDSIYFDRYGKYMAKGKPLGAYQYWSRVYDLMNTKGVNQQEAEKTVTKELSDQGITDLHYKDWFIIKNNIVVKDRTGKDIPKDKQYYEYEGWSGYDSMPVIQALNGSEYNLKSWSDEIIDGKDSAARQWLRNGSSGWRLDVANEVSEETWRAFRKTVKDEGDNAIIGEIWTDASNYILGDMYDSVMNYRYRESILNFVKGTKDDNVTVVSAQDSMNELEKMREQYPREALEAMMNLVGSHDTQRVISALDGYQKSVRGFAKESTETAKSKMKLIPLLQMTYIGAPTIYYGDEIGMVGCDDPDNRRGFTWGEGDKDLVEWYATLANIRNNYSCLRTGDVLPVVVEDEYKDDVMTYGRRDNDGYALIAGNRLGDNINVSLNVSGINDGTKLTNILNPDESYVVRDGKVTVNISSYNGIILVDKINNININYDGLKDSYDDSYKVKDRSIPVSIQQLLKEVEESKDGDEILLGTTERGISKDLLKSIINSNKNLVPIFKYGDFKIRINNTQKILDYLNDTGEYDFYVLFNLLKDINSNDTNSKILKDNFDISFNITTNLNTDNLAGSLSIEIPQDKGNEGKVKYIYYIDRSGKIISVCNTNVKDNIITIDINDLGDYVVSGKDINEVLPTPNPNPGEQIDPGISSGSDDQDKPLINNDNTGTNNKPLVKTGYVMGSSFTILAAILLIAAGVVVFILLKRRHMDESKKEE